MSVFTTLPYVRDTPRRSEIGLRRQRLLFYFELHDYKCCHLLSYGGTENQLWAPWIRFYFPHVTIRGATVAVRQKFREESGTKAAHNDHMVEGSFTSTEVGLSFLQWILFISSSCEKWWTRIMRGYLLKTKKQVYWIMKHESAAGALSFGSATRTNV